MQPTGGMRSIFERMTQPTEADMSVNSRLQTLDRKQVMRIVDHMAQVMEHLAHQRKDLTVNRITDNGFHGFTVKLDVTVPDNPLIIPNERI